jgi:DNA-binding protein YbaB
MEFRSVTISPDAVDPDDVEMLEDLVLAAIHDATAKVQELQQGALGGLDMGGLGGLLGG